MEKLDTANVMHRIAAKMRQQAGMTGQLHYRCMMIRAAISLEAEADLLDASAAPGALFPPPQTH